MICSTCFAWSHGYFPVYLDAECHDPEEFIEQKLGGMTLFDIKSHYDMYPGRYAV
jgi:hypothetical protein